jgi:hypothetical protein
VAFRRSFYRKGIGLIFPNQDVDVSGNTSEAGDAAGALEEFSFLVNKSLTLESD